MLKKLIPLTILLAVTGCQFLAGDTSQPPRPTIVPAQESASEQVAEAPAETATEAALPTAAPDGDSMGDAAPTEETTDEPTATATLVVTEEPTLEEPASNAAPTEEALAAPTEEPDAAALPLDALNISLTPVADGFIQPLYLTHAGDGSGRLFVVEQEGRIKVIENGEVLPQPFLDIVPLVGSSGNEQGLLSVAFHPNYADNGFFFVNYTNLDGNTVIARYQVSDDPTVANPDSATTLMQIGQPYQNHNGGLVKFGPDGYLYIGMGDGGAAGDPQNAGQRLDTLLGKILRIDVDNASPYGVPDDNPFVNDENARPEIWSYGWRNPWRFVFDPANADMYIADVGQNQYEEVHFEPAEAPGGLNYGWRLMEGFSCFEPSNCDPESLDVVLPITQYDHSLGCSITGGYVYRGEQFPTLRGTYLYADFCSGIIWGLRQNADGSWSEEQLLETGHTITSFGEDQAGELYLIDRTGSILGIGVNNS